MGFGLLWKRWMDILDFQSKMSVLVNGSPSKDFVVEKGLRQGDPLSPFLFVLVVEGLAGLVRKSLENGDYKGFEINGSCVVDILQFAVDTLILGEDSRRHVWALKAVLRAFELVSGLGINHHKSKLIGFNMPVSVVKELSRIQDNFLWDGGVEDKRRIHWGVMEPRAVRALLRLIRLENSSAVFLMETRLKKDDLGNIQFKSGFEFGYAIDYNGSSKDRSGGLILLIMAFK
ncbi:uncharacterized protein LOC131640177 [Vicia villosa]|uniref:uncharacterized protein LOC131640177 n=1 Tax=Vicia villosa TaxID=3911 RepID=UPI00273C4FCA|nr:uncharacterized protein LOC131640177 [Vicia villosa]